MKLPNGFLGLPDVAPEVHIEVVLRIQSELRPAALELHLLKRALAAMVGAEPTVNIEQREFLFFCEGFEVAHGIGDAIHLVVRAGEQSHPKRTHQASSCPMTNRICWRRRSCDAMACLTVPVSSSRNIPKAASMNCGRWSQSCEIGRRAPL